MQLQDKTGAAAVRVENGKTMAPALHSRGQTSTPAGTSFGFGNSKYHSIFHICQALGTKERVLHG